MGQLFINVATESIKSRSILQQKSSWRGLQGAFCYRKLKQVSVSAADDCTPSLFFLSSLTNSFINKMCKHHGNGDREPGMTE